MSVNACGLPACSKAGPRTASDDNCTEACTGAPEALKTIPDTRALRNGWSWKSADASLPNRESDALRFGEARGPGTVDWRTSPDRIGRAGAGGHVVIAGRQAVDAKLAHVIGLIAWPHALQATLSSNHSRTQNL